MLYHASSLGNGINLHIGATGVDLFFIISGTVMCLSVSDRTNVSDFIWARVSRVVPLYWIGTLCAVAVFMCKTGNLPSGFDVLQSMFFLPPKFGNFFPLLYPGWSLNFEMFFYALITLFLIVHRKNSMHYVLVVTLALGASWRTVELPYVSYYCVPGLIEFAAGVLIGMAVKRQLIPGKHIAKLLLGSGAGLLALHAVWDVENAAFAWGIPWAMILIGSLSFESSRIVRSPVVQLLGAASYSIYLTHPFVIWGVDTLEKHTGTAYFVATSVLCVICGVIVHVALEKPLLSMLRKIRGRPHERISA